MDTNKKALRVTKGFLKNFWICDQSNNYPSPRDVLHAVQQQRRRALYAWIECM